MANLHNISAFDFLQAIMHALQLKSIEDNDNTPPDLDDNYGDAKVQAGKDISTELLAFLIKHQGSTYAIIWLMSCPCPRSRMQKALNSWASPMQVLHLHWMRIL